MRQVGITVITVIPEMLNKEQHNKKNKKKRNQCKLSESMEKYGLYRGMVVYTQRERPAKNPISTKLDKTSTNS